jgi:hypothetical protein
MWSHAQVTWPEKDLWGEEEREVFQSINVLYYRSISVTPGKSEAECRFSKPEEIF